MLVRASCPPHGELQERVLSVFASLSEPDYLFTVHPLVLMFIIPALGIASIFPPPLSSQIKSNPTTCLFILRRGQIQREYKRL